MPELDDHTLLVRLDEKITALIEIIREMKEDIENKADTDRVKNLEVRVASVERKVWSFAGAITAFICLLRVFGVKF